MQVIILATDIYTRGGIARYTATLAEALGDLLGRGSVDVLPLLASAHERRAALKSGFEAPNYRILNGTTDRLTLSAKLRHAVRAFACARSGYDLAICTHVGVAPIAAALRVRYRIPYWVVCHGSEAWVRLPALKRASLRRAQNVLAVSACTAEAVCRENALAKNRIRVLHNAIPDGFARQLAGLGGDSLRPASCAREGAAVLLSVGSLNREHAYKGVDTVINALPQILAAVPEARYVVVGGGDHRAPLERQARQVGVAGRVTFAGEVTDAELAAQYRACDVFVLPSRAIMPGSAPRARTRRRAEGEGFGRVYVEAALAGKPVVGSREGGAAEAVLHGRTGLLVDPLSTGEVANAVVSLVRSPETARAMGAEGRRWALANFTTPALRRALEEMLNSPELLSRHPADLEQVIPRATVSSAPSAWTSARGSRAGSEHITPGPTATRVATAGPNSHARLPGRAHLRPSQP
jgi:phosphatidyl-myo-inositol dimannoside synthase